MKYSFCINTTPQAAAKLLISNDIDIQTHISQPVAQSILYSLLDMSADELLLITDGVKAEISSPSDIPQFSNIEMLSKVPAILTELGIGALSYAQLGFYLKKDPDAKLVANTKFGETYGKGAAMLGLVAISSKKFTLSALSNSFCLLSDTEKEQAIIRLFFRVPIVQHILKEAKTGTYNGYDALTILGPSTQKRRSQCLRRIFKLMENLRQKELSDRLNNIKWDKV